MARLLGLLALAAVTACGNISRKDGSGSNDDAGVDPVAQLQIDQSMHNFGTVTVNTTSSTVTLTVTNTGDGTSGSLTTTVTGAAASTIALNADTCEGKALAAGETCTMTVTMTPTAVGMQTATVEVTGAPGGTVTTALSGTSVAAATISLSPDPADYGSVVRGSTGQTTLTVTNNGGETTGALSFMATGTNANDYSVTGGSCSTSTMLAPSGTCTLIVTFSPATRGDRSAMFQVSATPGGTATANLTATGLINYTLTVNKTGSSGTGTVASNPAGAITCDTANTDCMQVYAVGATAPMETIVATAASGSRFASFTGSCSASPCTLTMDADHTVTANFIKLHDLIVNMTLTGTGAAGTVTSTSNPTQATQHNCTTGSCTVAFDEGATITLTAAPGANSVFSGWTGCPSGNAASTCTVSSINAATTVGATFTRTYSLTINPTNANLGQVTSNQGGITCGIASSDCTEAYPQGTVVVLTAAAVSGAAFTGWSNCPSPNNNQCTVTMNAAATVGVTFQPTHQLTVSTTGSGQVTSNPAGITCGNGAADCTEIYTQGTSVVLTALPGTGQVFSGWTSCANISGNTCTVAMTAAASVTANFVQGYQLTVNLTGGPNGQVTSNPAGITCGTGATDCGELYAQNTMVVLTAAPATSSVFTGWSGACSGTNLTCNVTMSQARTVGATFAPAYLLTVNLTGSGSGQITSSPSGITCGLGSSDCTEPYPQGNVTLTATPDLASSIFVGWSNAPGCNATPVCTVNISAATTVEAKFDAVIKATWDPAFSGPGVTYSNGDLSIAMPGTTDTTRNVRTTIGKATGKWYWEILVTSGSASLNGGGLGIVEAGMSNSTSYIGLTASGLSFGYGPDNTQYYWNWPGANVANNLSPPTSSAVANGTRYMFALDMDAKRLWIGQNGGWYHNGNPATGTTPTITNLSGTVFPGVTFYTGSTNAFTANFGTQPFAHAVPTGFNPGLYGYPVTWDPSFAGAGVTYTNGNLSIASAVGATRNVRTTVGKTSGKWYWELKADGGDGSNQGGIGVMDATLPASAAWIGSQPNGMSFGYGVDNVQWYLTWTGVTAVGTPPAGSAITAGTVYMFALDMATRQLWIGQNGTWFNTGNPALGINSILSGIPTSSPVFPGVTLYQNSLNTFNASFAGGFVYPRPAGFAPLID